MSKFLLLLLPIQLFAQGRNEEITRWEKQASQVTIIRDHFGIPHIYGKTDADAVFGLMYAQCEDDFRRVEMNYLEKLGRTAEVNGSSEIFEDLVNAIILDPAEARADYQRAPDWLKKLCQAFSDGINYYLHKHPGASRVLHRFEPWYPLLWTDGSIGAINTAGISADDLRLLYDSASAGTATAKKVSDEEPATGSNGFAFAPAITESGRAILYINPHVTFYFRPEVHMVSEQGLNVYGAVTWGQFFVYQGFNEHCGWMHTSSMVDAADTYLEKIKPSDQEWSYEYQGKIYRAREKKIRIAWRNADGSLASREFVVHFTRHGPVMANKNGQYISVRADNRLLNGLLQCWQRTKARNLAEFEKALSLLGNISNNTVYADADGNIAYWHGNRIPVRDPGFDWSNPVDGSVAATEWKGYHPVSETVHLLNPANGWLQNCNSTPFSAAGNHSPDPSAFPAYMAPDPENFRGLNAVRVLGAEKKYTIEKVIRAGYDRHLTAFEKLVPALVSAFDQQVSYQDTLFAYLAGPIEILRRWDFQSSETSVATTLAIEWGQRLLSTIAVRPVDQPRAGMIEKTDAFLRDASPAELLDPFWKTIQDLQFRFGRWQIGWGEINRFQRISADINNHFDDQKPSYPVGFTSSTWGMLPSYTSRVYPGTRKRYGVNGNSFICAVEFGPKIRARSLLAGGESGHPESPHFFDQGEMYSRGQFKDVLFYREDVQRNAENTYHPGSGQ